MPSEFASQIAASRRLAEIKIGEALTIQVVQIFPAVRFAGVSYYLQYRFYRAVDTNYAFDSAHMRDEESKESR